MTTASDFSSNVLLRACSVVLLSTPSDINFVIRFVIKIRVVPLLWYYFICTYFFICTFMYLSFSLQCVVTKHGKMFSHCLFAYLKIVDAKT